MTGVITSLPPVVEQPPGNNSSNPAGLPGVTYTAAIPTLPQTWTGLQTYTLGSMEFAGSTSGNTILNASAVASGVLTLPAATDTLIGRNTTDTLTNKTLTSPAINGATISGTFTGGTYSAITVSGASAWNGNKIGLPYGGTNADLSATGGTSQFLKQSSVGAAITVGQPAFTDISGSVAATQLPNPSATTLGGIQSLAAVGSKWINAISTLGVPSATQPAFTDISGTIAAGQIPANVVTNAMRAQMAAYTLKGNATGATANEADIDVTALTSKPTPVSADIVLIQDSAAANAFKKTTVGAISSVGAVSSFNARTGVVVPVLGDYAYSANTMALPTKYWTGCQHSNNVGTPNTKVDISASTVRDSTDAFNIITTAKTIDFSVNGAVNTLDTGTIAASKKYYTFLIMKADFTSGALGSLSPTAPTLPTGYVYFRRIGMVMTDASAHVLPFTQVNDKWYYNTTIRDVNNNAVGTTTIKAALSVPTVQGITAFIACTGFAAAAVTYYVWPGFLPDTAKTGGALNISATGGGTLYKSVEVDSSAQVNIQSGSASTTVVIDLLGWQDIL